jgi:hypothetical protein
MFACRIVPAYGLQGGAPGGGYGLFWEVSEPARF